MGISSSTYFDFWTLLSYDSSLRLQFTIPSYLRFMIPLYTFDFRFSPLLRTIPTIFDPPLPPPYSIPSLVVSVVAIAVTEVLAYTSPPPRFYTLDSIPSILYLPIYDAPGLPSKTSNAYITAVIAEVLAQISRTILGTLDRCFK